MTASRAVKVKTLRDRISDEEWRLRVDLAAAYRLCALFGWDELIFTHLSARVPGPEHHFLVNPFGLMFEEITASSLLKVDLEGRVVEESDDFINPAAFVIHGAIHGAREDARAVLHLHTVAGVAVAAQKDGLLPITQNALVVLGSLAYHDYEGLAVGMDERQRLIADLGKHHYLILRNHGLLTVGESVAAAFVRLYFLQRACEMQVAALAGNRAVIAQGDSTIERVGGQGKAAFSDRVADVAWAALKRKLDRHDPSYDH